MKLHGAIELEFGGDDHWFRLSLDGITELESKRDCALFELIDRLHPIAHRARLNDISETIRISLIGGGMLPLDASALVKRYCNERPLDESRDIAYAVVLAGAARVAGDQVERAVDDGADDDAYQKLNVGVLLANAATMGIQDVGELALGEWVACCKEWSRIHGGSKDVEPPAPGELQAASERVRGVDI